MFLIEARNDEESHCGLMDRFELQIVQTVRPGTRTRITFRIREINASTNNVLVTKPVTIAPACQFPTPDSDFSLLDAVTR